MKDLDGKTAIVTGGAQAIGLAIARAGAADTAISAFYTNPGDFAHISVPTTPNLMGFSEMLFAPLLLWPLM